MSIILKDVIYRWRWQTQEYSKKGDLEGSLQAILYEDWWKKPRIH